MDPIIFNKVCDDNPKFNPTVANGIATQQVGGILKEVNRIWKSIDLPDGLEYVGCKRTTPKKKFEVMSQGRNGQLVYELTDSSYFMVEFNFEFHGEPLYPKYILLPYVNEIGVMNIRGKEFVIHCVLADKTFSVGTNDVFIRFQRARLSFERLQHHYIANNEREDIYLTWSWIHHDARKRFSKRANGGIGKLVFTTTTNYLFAEFGVTETFKRFAKADVVIGTTDITEQTYPADKWVICKTVGVRPVNNKDDYYEFTKLRVAVPKEQYTSLTKELICGLFYLADNYPDRVLLEELDNTWIWKVILGDIIMPPGNSEGLMVKAMEDHQQSLYEYVDTMALEEFKKDGYDFENIYDVFVHIMGLMSGSLLENNEQHSSMYNKRFVVLRYLLDDLVYEINTKIMYGLNGLAKKKGDLDIKDIEKYFNRLKPTVLMGLSNHSKHPEVSVVNSVVDNYLIGITNEIVMQDRAGSKASTKRINLNDPNKHLDASIAEVASYNLLPKSDPTGRNRVNPFVNLNSRYEVERNPELKDLLDDVQNKITAKYKTP